MAAICSFGQEQDSQTIIGRWIQVGPKDSGLCIMIITGREMILKEIPFMPLRYRYGSEESLSSGYKINNGTIIFDDGDSMEYTFTDNDTLFIEFFGEFKRIHQDILLNGSFYPDNDDREFNYESIWEFTHIEFFDDKKGAFYILDTSLPFEYEIYDIYLILEFEVERSVFIIKSNTIIEGLYTILGGGSIFRKK
jgi:hypothetical protein